MQLAICDNNLLIKGYSMKFVMHLIRISPADSTLKLPVLLKLFDNVWISL